MLLDAKRYPVLTDVPDDLVAALSAAARPRVCAEGEDIYREGEDAHTLYFLARGKALFVSAPRPDMSVALGAIKPGGCFGWSAALQGERYRHNVVAAEECEVVCLDGGTMRRIMAELPCRGCALMRNLMALVNDRLNLRTSQLLRLIEEHPDFAADRAGGLPGEGL